MAANLLAEEMIRITTEGIDRAEQLIDSIGAKFEKMTVAARKAEDFVKRLGKSLIAAASAPHKLFAALEVRINKLSQAISKMISPLRSLALGGSLGIGGILFGAASGTFEADRFGKAMEYLTRVLGNELAPYMRMATQFIIELANAYRSLAPETRETIAKFAIFGTLLGAAATILPVVISGVATLAGAIGTLLNPISATVAVLIGIGAVGVSAFTDIDEAERAWLVNHGRYMELATISADNFFRKFSTGFAEYIRKAGVGIGLTATAALEKLGYFAPGTLQGGIADEQATLRNRANEQKRAIDEQKRALEAVQAVRKQAFGKNGGGFFAGIEGAIERIKNAGKGGGFGLKLDVRFESAQQTFDRLQIAFAEQSKGVQNVGEAQLIEAKKANDNLQAVKAGVEKIAAKGPMIQ